MSPKNLMTSPQPTHPPLGTLIDAGALELVEVLGVGGYGVVYRAVGANASHPKSYAVKCLMQTQSQPWRQRHLHIREITLHQLASAHPNVVTLHRVVEEHNCTYIIMDYANDGDLFSQILHGSRYLGDDFLIKHVFLQLLDAVEYCHSLGIYHRDLKPENVLCFEGGVRIAITDFGLATTDKFSGEFRTGSVYHMSPECQGDVFAPTGSYSPMFNDIWSLAIILLNLATGRNPWKSASASDPTFQAYLCDPVGFLPTVLPISSEINDILIRMLEVDWRHRMTLPELRRAIEEVDTFYSDGVIFDGSMARCPWESGMQIDSASSKKESAVPPTSTRSEIRSRWSNDSLAISDIVFDSPPEGRWSDDESPEEVGWSYDSPTFSSRGFDDDDDELYDSPRTPPSTRSSLSSSGSRSGSSLPATPNSIDASFAAKIELNRKVLHVNTDYCDPRVYNDRMTPSCSADSAMMQTAIEYNPISSSYFLASPAVKSLAISPTAERGKAPPPPVVEDKEMEVMSSSWNFSAVDVSIRSSSSSHQACSNDSRIECDRDEREDGREDGQETTGSTAWQEIQYRPPHPTPLTPQQQTRGSFFDFHPFTAPASRPAYPTKRATERSSLFRFFPRSPRSSSSSSSSASRKSRPRSPESGVWISPRGGVVPELNLPRDGSGSRRRRAKGSGGRLWFSPGKLFSAIGV